jgi:Ca2+-binding EF-hand superfamily protein
MNIPELVDELFELFDTNNDGVISRSEFVDLIDCLLQEKGIKMCESIFKRFDVDHDNAISKEELTNMVIDLAL